MRKRIVAGNWKMNKTLEEGINLINDVVSQLSSLSQDQEVIFCTPFIHLAEAAAVVTDTENCYVGSQDCSAQEAGAYTGEVSVSMIRSTGAEYVIIGHSERRAYFHEDAALLRTKIDQALDQGLKPIFCCGEKFESRKAGTQEDVVREQIEGSLFHLDAEAIRNIVIAYEPVWAIGTGEVASPQQAEDMHAFIRSLLEKKYGSDVSDDISILYGGSVKPGNAEELFDQPNVDGGLIGGASLKAEDFLAIIHSL